MKHTRHMKWTSRSLALRVGLSVFAVTLSAACAPSGVDTDVTDPGPVHAGGSGAAPSEVDGTGALEQHSAIVDDLERTWSTYVPPGNAGPTAPLLVVIHGTGDTGSGIRGGIGPDFEKLADEHGFSVAYVDGYQNNWNECRREGVWPAKERDLDDVGLIREVARTHGSNGPVYAVGFSSGGHMAMRLAIEAPDLVDGVAAVAANPPTEDNQGCVGAGGAVPIMFIQGREDSINPLEGGEVRVGSGSAALSRGEVLSAVEGAEWFARRNGAESAPILVNQRDGDAETSTWQGNAPVRLVVLDHLGHSFPTVSGRWGLEGGARYDAPGRIWSFFSGD